MKTYTNVIILLWILKENNYYVNLDQILSLPSIYLFESLIFFKQNKKLFKNYHCGSEFKNCFKILNHKTSFLNYFTKYNMVLFLNAIPKYIQEKNFIIKFKLKNFQITKAVYNITEFLKDRLQNFEFEEKWSTNKCFEVYPYPYPYLEIHPSRCLGSIK